jgi:hypothetical protein
MRAPARDLARLLLAAIVALSSTGGTPAFAATAAASAPAAALDLEPHWKAGAHVDYVITKTRARTGVPASSGDTDVRIDILAATPEGYRIAWTFGETRLRDPATQANPIAARMASLMKGRRSVLRLDRSARVLEVVNWQELRDAMRPQLAEVAALMKKSGIDPVVAEAMVSQAGDVYSSEAKLRQFGLNEARVLFFALGRTYAGATPLAYDVHLPSPFGGEPIPARMEVALQSLDRASGKAVVTMRQQPDAQAMAGLMERATKAIAAQAGASAPAPGALPRLRIEDGGEFTIDLATGWATTASQTRTVDSDGRTQVETTALRRKP